MTDPLPEALDAEHDPAHLAAAEWFVRLQSPDVSLEDAIAWQSWMSASPANARAYARIEEVAELVRDVPAPESVSLRQRPADQYDPSVPVRQWLKRRTGVPRRAAVAMAASLAAAACVWFWNEPSAQEYSTVVGQSRQVSLSDGSTIVMGGYTAIEVKLTRQRRSIELIRGEALFKVAKDRTRPFSVRAGDATVVAVGTVFDVLRGSDRAIVSVTEGRVLVEPVVRFLPVSVLHEFKPKVRTVPVDAGEQTTAGTAGIEEPTRVEDPNAVAAWQTGRLAFRLQPLRYVLEDVNRYARKPIVLEGDELGAIVITGTVERENIAGWVGSLERAFDLQAVEEADRIVIRSR